MAIIKHSLRRPTFSPWHDLEQEFGRLSRLFEDAPFGGTASGMWSPPVNVTETKEEMVLTAELPGMTQEDVQVELENNVLSISGEKNEVRTEGDEERRYHVWERSYGSFRRAFTLPHTVSADEVSASFENGILTVKLPKAAEAKGRKIEISKH